jgi:hypothetical protein
MARLCRAARAFHLTVARALKSITRSRELTPSHCQTFGESLLYFSYGPLYHRPRDYQTEQPLEFPIALAFSRDHLARIARYYPYDAGAAAKGSSDRLGVFDEAPGGWFLPVARIYNFLSQDMSAHRIDQQQRTIERISDDPFPVLDALEWVAYPHTVATEICELWRARERQKFRWRAYAFTILRPADRPARICDTVPSKESAMLNWLLRLWRKIGFWIHPRPAPKTYHPSNLHGRRR